jgi:predicted metalloprotease
MRLGGGRESGNIEDRRGGGGGGFGRVAGIGGGLGGIVLVVLALLFGVDPSVILQGDPTAGMDPARREATQGGGAGRPASGEPDEGRRFVARVLAETEDVWNGVFAQAGRRYDAPVLVLFNNEVASGCGNAPATVGPFYCPADRRLYLDLDFLADLQRRINAPGDFAAAYVIAHEVGHHVQNLLGILDRVAEARGRGGAESNALQVRVELQADCLAGLWARRAQASRGILEEGDLEEGLNAAAAVGDDRMQRRGQGRVVPESFTHGSSAQRVTWFRRGLETGELRACDTFGTARP